MNRLLQGALGALIGVIGGTAISFVSIPATNVWLRSPGWNDDFYNFPLWFAIGGLHGAFCGFIVGRGKQRPILRNIIFGGVVGLILDFAFAVAFAVVFTVFHLPETGIIYFPAAIVGFLFVGIAYFLKLAITSIFHGTAIGLLTGIVIKLFSLVARYR